MADNTRSEQLDKVIRALLGPAGGQALPAEAAGLDDRTLRPPVELIGDLRELPRPSFKARLKSELERRARVATPVTQRVAEVRTVATPYLAIRNAAAAIEFYKNAFGATEVMRLGEPGGSVRHAELDIGGARVYLADESPEMDFRGPESLGSSSMRIHLDVPDVDEWARRAVAAGASVVRPVADQFYGDRSGQFRDPFGHLWVLSTHKEDVSLEEIKRRAAESSGRGNAAPSGVKFIREGFHTVTPYLIIAQAAEWINFVKQAFHADEHFRAQRPGAEDLIMHAEVQIGDSLVELADANPEYPATPSTLLLRAGDPDAVYARAVEAGATVFDPLSDHDYGSRGGTVVDRSGNRWHIFKPTPGNKIFADFRTITAHLYAADPGSLIDFLRTGLGGEEIYRAQTPDGSVPHAQVRIGDSVVALAGGHGPYRPQPATLHLYVPDTDALYARALAAGAISLQPPTDQPYGDRSAGVRDPFGNRWFLATHIRDVAF